MPSPITFDADEDSEHQSNANNNYEIASNKTTTNTNSGDDLSGKSSHPIFIEDKVTETYHEALHPGSTSLYDEPEYKSNTKDTPEPSLPSVGAVNNSTGALQQLEKSTRRVTSTDGTISTEQQQNQQLQNQLLDNNRRKVSIINSINNVLVTNQTVLSSVTIAVITKNHLGTRGAMALGLAGALLQKIGEKRSIKSGISRLNNKRKKLFGGFNGQSSSLDSCDGVVSSSSVGDLPVGRDMDMDVDMKMDIDGDTGLGGDELLVGRVKESGDVVNEQESMIVAKNEAEVPIVRLFRSAGYDTDIPALQIVETITGYLGSEAMANLSKVNELFPHSKIWGELCIESEGLASLDTSQTPESYLPIYIQVVNTNLSAVTQVIQHSLEVNKMRVERKEETGELNVNQLNFSQGNTASCSCIGLAIAAVSVMNNRQLDYSELKDVTVKSGQILAAATRVTTSSSDTGYMSLCDASPLLVSLLSQYNIGYDTEVGIDILADCGRILNHLKRQGTSMCLMFQRHACVLSNTSAGLEMIDTLANNPISSRPFRATFTSFEAFKRLFSVYVLSKLSNSNGPHTGTHKFEAVILRDEGRVEQVIDPKRAFHDELWSSIAEHDPSLFAETDTKFHDAFSQVSLSDMKGVLSLISRVTSSNEFLQCMGLRTDVDIAYLPLAQMCGLQVSGQSCLFIPSPNTRLVLARCEYLLHKAIESITELESEQIRAALTESSVDMDEENEPDTEMDETEEAKVEEEEEEEVETPTKEKSKEMIDSDTDMDIDFGSSSPAADEEMEEDSDTLKSIFSVKSIEAGQFDCDKCEDLIACSQWSSGDYCLNCSQEHGGIATAFRVMHCKHRELIREKCSSLSDDPADLRKFDTLVPPSAFCEHKHCRQIVLRHLMPGSNKDLKYCDCGAAVCDACFNYHREKKTCIDDGIDESYAWNDKNDDDDDNEVEYTGLEYNNLECQYSSVVYTPGKSAYQGRLNNEGSYYDTAVYGTGVESATQLAAHYYIKGWRLPQKTVETLLHFVPRLFNEIEIVSSTKVTSRNKKELGKLQGRLKRSVSESLRLIASNIRKHIDNNKYSQGNELTRANAVVASLHRIAQLADTSGGITSVEQFESDAVQATLQGTDFPWQNSTGGTSRLDVSVDVGEPAPIDTTRPDIREMNEVMRLVFSQKKKADRGDGDVYKFDKCFEPITGRGAAMNAEVNYERRINLHGHVCQCFIKVLAKNDVRLRNLLKIEDIANLRYVHPEEDEVDDAYDNNLSLADMMDTYSLCDIRDQVLLAVCDGRIDRDMSMRIIREYAQSNALANGDRVPIMCSTDNNKHSSPEAVKENEMKIISRLNNDDTNTDRILHDIAVVENENEAEYLKQYVSKQNKRLTFILEHTTLIQSIDNNRSTTPKHTYDQFETILKTSFEAAANEFPKLSHLKNITFENVCSIYSRGDWDDPTVRVAALNKLTRELPMVIANECADERCSRKLLDYDIVERGAVDANHLKQRDGHIPVPADFVCIHGAVKYIEHVIEYKVVANCNYHHSKREHREQAIIDQKKIRLFKNDARIEDIRRYNPTQLLSMSEDSADTELFRMQDKVTFSFLEFELRGGFSKSGDGCNASDMRCLVSDYFEDLPDHDILFDDMLAVSNVEINNSFGMKEISHQYYDIHGTSVTKNEKVAIPFLTGLVKELCGLCDDQSSRPGDMNLTIVAPDEQAGVKADHLGTKKNKISLTQSLVPFMNEMICCAMVNCFSDRKITYNQEKAKEKGHCGSYADILSFRNYDTSEHKRSIM